MEELKMLDPVEERTPGSDVVERGGTLRRTQTEFTTAVDIVKPRRRGEVLDSCLEEATLAGEEFYYSWTIKGKGGDKLVEGLSFQGAVAAARNWGNCAIPCNIEEYEDRYIFTATFLDMETGFNLQRTFRQRKGQGIGMKDSDRAADIVFQIGQSKAIRNVILNSLPSWLLSKMLEKSKENIIAKITKMGVDVARKKTLEFFAKYGVTVERIEHKIGKKQKAWDAEVLALLQGAMSSLLAGQESADELFPDPNQEVKGKTESKGPGLTKRLEETKEKHGAGEAPPNLDAARDELDACFKLSGIDRTLFMQAAVFELKKLEKDWTVEDYSKATGFLNQVADKTLTIVTNAKGQPVLFERDPAAV